MKEIEALERDWNDLAEIDPMWAICSSVGKDHRKWESSDFFRTGVVAVKQSLAHVHSLGIPLTKHAALDFGCGIGRLTQALAEEFDICYGVDISPEMIRLANQFNTFGDRCRYFVNHKDDLRVFNDATFDFLYTINVLQHMRPHFMKRYLSEFIRVLGPGGIAIVHVPVQRLWKDRELPIVTGEHRYHPKRILEKLRGKLIGCNVTTGYYRSRRLGLPKRLLYDRFGFRPDIPMNQMEENEICELVAKSGARVVHVAKIVDGGMLSGVFTIVK